MTTRPDHRDLALSRDPSQGWIVAALATLALGACATAPDDARPRLGLALEGDAAVNEGDERPLLLSRTGAERPVEALLAVSGEARPDLDYRLDGAEFLGDDRYRVRLETGETRKELTLVILDDSAAEAAESLQLRLLSPESSADGYTVDRRARRVSLAIAANDFAVTAIEDDGEGSLRQAIRNANAFGEGAVITFDHEAGPFGPPQTLLLERKLPVLEGDFTIEGFIPDQLWQASGVIVSGGDRHRVFEVAPGARIAIRNLTVAEGTARDGAGILNRGDLVVSGVTFEGNRARRAGGGLLHETGSLYLVNSTLAGNHAGREGGALASRAPARLVHATITDNEAPEGGGIYSTGTLHLANSVLWGNGGDCLAAPPATPKQGHNLIGGHAGCGTPLLSVDAQLEPLNYFNGPTRTMPLSGRSPAANLADNALSVDERGEALRWDQRGNGDPRFVAGYADMGAFEVQAFPTLRVNTPADNGLRSCFPSLREGCPLRAAIELALAMRRDKLITFDPRVFGADSVITLDAPLPEIDWPLRLEAAEERPVTILVPEGTPLPVDKLELRHVEIMPR